MVSIIKWMILLSLFTLCMLIFIHSSTNDEGHLSAPTSGRSSGTTAGSGVLLERERNMIPQLGAEPKKIQHDLEHQYNRDVKESYKTIQGGSIGQSPTLLSNKGQNDMLPQTTAASVQDTTQIFTTTTASTSKAAAPIPLQSLGNQDNYFSNRFKESEKVDLVDNSHTSSLLDRNVKGLEKVETIQATPVDNPQGKPESATSNVQDNAKTSDVKWCLDAKKRFSVNPGKSWGSLRGKERVEWASRGCDTVVATGRSFSCDDSWGSFNYFTSWKLKEELKCDGRQEDSSSVICRTQEATSSSACLYENVVIDFGKAMPSGDQRSFGKGFLKANCRGGRGGNVPLPPGAMLSSDSSDQSFGTQCDMVEEKPSFFMSHDLIFNLGHTISDFWIVWTTMRAMEQDFEEYQLVNMDSIRGNGPAGRGSKLTFAGHPDHISPFFQTYEQWFNNHGIVKAIDYGKQTVCFRKAVFQAKPGPAHIWTSLEFGKGSATEKCSLTEGYRSTLLKEYNVFNRVKWGLIKPPNQSSKPLATMDTVMKQQPFALSGRGGGREETKQKPLSISSSSLLTKLIQQEKRISYAGQRYDSYESLKELKPSITLVMRKGVNMRVYMNEQEVVDALQNIPGAGVFRAVDLSVIPYREQIELVHNTSLLIGMHGAALFHLLSMDVDSAIGCAVVELYHKRWSQSEAVPTVSNMARFLGVDYYKLRSKEQESVEEIRKRGKGTMVDAVELREIAIKAIAKLNQRASSLY